MLPAPIKIEDHPPSRTWVEFYEVQSESRPGVAYVVAKKNDGTWGCDCPAWIFHRGQKGNCKHIRHVLQYIQVGEVLSIFKPPAAQRIITKEKLQKALSRFSLVEVD